MALSPLLALYVAAWLVDRRSVLPAGDEPDLLGYAGRLLDGHYAVAGPATAYLWHGPGLPVALAPWLALHAPLWVPRLVLGPATLFAAVVALAGVLRASLPGCRARLVAACFGLYLPLLSVLSSLHKEPLCVLFVVAAMGATGPALRDGSRRAIAAAAVALAGLAMTRVEYGWVLLVLLGTATLVAVIRHDATARRAAAVLALALLLCTPWLAYTHHVSGRVGYWGNSGGLSLYWMSSPDEDQLGEWHAVHTVLQDGALKAYRPLFRSLRRLTPRREDEVFTALAVRQAVGHPLKFVGNLVANTGRMAIAWPFGVAVPWWGVAGVAISNLALLTVLLRGRRRWRRQPQVVAFGAFAAVALALHLVPSSEPRMMIPVVPLLIWLAAAGAPAVTPRQPRP